MAALALDGRLAVVTGAGSGIGRAIAIEAARRGMTVALADVNEAGLGETLAAIGGDRGMIRVVDVRDAAALADFAEAAIARFGAPATVFANAGVLKYQGSIRPDLDRWRMALDVNLMGVVNSVAAFLGRMVDTGEPAQFVITGSMGSFVAAPELGPYCATKHAVWALAQSLRLELSKDAAVGISLLAPPRVDTPLLSESIARTRSTRGDDAATALQGSAMTAVEIATCALDGARDRRFYIAPQTADVAPIIRQRIDELLGG